MQNRSLHRAHQADQMLHARVRGFTLLEVLIALSIFALIGVGTNHVLRTVIDTRDLTEAYSTRFSQVQRALMVMDRDLVQASDRGIRDELGDPRAAFLVGEDPYRLEFTRKGWRNPLHQKRSDLQRVAYSLQDGVLLRHYWLVLDRAEDSVPVTQRLLDNVEDFVINVTSERGDITFSWPAETSSDSTGAAKSAALPARIEIVLTIREVGEVSRLIDLVAAPAVSPGDGSGNPDGNDGGGVGR